MNLNVCITGSRMSVSVCIATYRRNGALDALLGDLSHQMHKPDEVVVVDNDAAGGAEAIVQSWRARGLPFPIRYAIQPERNISLTRNRTVELASGEWLAFVDDDERVPESWLLVMLLSLRTGADGILGPVDPVLPSNAPKWIRCGRFYDWFRMASGTTVPANQLRFGNIVLRGDLLRSNTPPFDPAYGLTGGEDGDLLGRLARQGARFIWCDQALVYEPVETSRLSLRWLLLRALRGGQDFARHTFAGLYGDPTPLRRVKLFLRALVQMLVAALLVLVVWPGGRHRAAYWLIRSSANLGKLSAFYGLHYSEYASGPAR